MGLSLLLGCGSSVALSGSGGNAGDAGGAGASSSGAGGTSSGGEEGGASDGGAGGGAMLCGDGIVDPGEVCDDGNNEDGDGCDSTCSTLECVVPLTHASVQAGLDDVSCAIVYLQPGSYHETLSIARDVIVKGAGAGASELNALQQGHTVSLGFGHQIELHDLSVTGGTGPVGAGILGASDLTLVRVIVEGNHAISVAALGGGIFIDGANLTLNDSIVQGNIATAAGGPEPGSATYASGGGIALQFGLLTMLNNSAVQNNVATANSHLNSAVRGGGVFVLEGSAIVQGSTLSGNLASITTDPNAPPTAQQSASVLGGGAYLEHASMTVGTMGSVAMNTAEVIVASPSATAGSFRSQGGGVYLYTLSDPISLSVTTGASIDGNEATATCPGGCSAMGGGVYAVRADVSLSEAALSGNNASVTSQGLGSAPFADAQAGGAHVQAGSLAIMQGLSLADSSVSGNSASATIGGAAAGFARAGGGGLSIGAAAGDAIAQLLALRSTISGNTAAGSIQGRGGAVFAETGSGGAQVTVELSSATVTGNQASSAGGGMALLTGLASSQVQAEIRNSILALNTAAAGADCFAVASSFSAANYSILGAGNGCPIPAPGAGLLPGVDPLLGALQLNGGATQTHALGAASPAIDGGDPGGCDDHDGGALGTDQRGVARVVGPACDIGAYEYVP